MVSSLDDKDEYIDELRRIVTEKPLPEQDIVTIASDTGAINAVFNNDGTVIGYTYSASTFACDISKSDNVKSKHIDDIKWTGG